MGARPSTFRKGGGGYLNNVDGVWTDYTWTDEFNGEPFKPGKDPKTKKERFHSLYCRVSFRLDGADEDTTTTLFAGGADDFNISEDGKTIWDSAYETEEEAIAAGESARQLGANTGVAKFINSLVKPVDDAENGFPEDQLSEDSINFESCLGTRLRLVQRTDAEATKKFGKRVDKKTKKEYDRQDLLVSTVYSLPGAEATPAPAAKTPAKGKTAAKPAAAAKAAPAAKSAGKPAAAPKGTDVAEKAVETLQTILAEAGGSITKDKMGMKVIGKLMKDPERDAVRKYLFDDKNLAAIEGIAYDAATKTISVEE